jgi:hypothetical protein
MEIFLGVKNRLFTTQKNNSVPKIVLIKIKYKKRKLYTYLMKRPKIRIFINKIYTYFQKFILSFR